MGITVKDETFHNLMDKLFGPDHQLTKKLSLMTASGATAKAGLFNFVVTVPAHGTSPDNVVFACKLPTLTLHIINGMNNHFDESKQAVSAVIAEAFATYPKWSKQTEAVAAAIEEQAVQSVAAAPVFDASMDPPIPGPTALKKAAAKKTVKKVNIDWAADPVTPAPAADFLKSTGPSDKELHAASKVNATTAHLEAAGFSPVKVSTVVPLKDARSVGQKVKGTSAGSNYRVFAVGPINLAVKIANGQASVRAEPQGAWAPNAKTHLASIGFSDNGDYMSVHMTLGGVPPMRVLGAVAFSLDLKFNQIATSMEAVYD